MKPQATEDCRTVLKRVGVALIVFGAIDIGVMMYCIAHQISYSSSFNLFAVISGIYLWRGHPWYVRFVTRAAAFFVGAFCVALLVFPFLFPLDLGLIELCLRPVETIGGMVAAVGVTVFLFWVCRQLRAPAVVAAYAKPGCTSGPPWLAFALAAALGIGTGAMVGLSLSGATARKAIELAKARTGDGYRYSVSHLSWSGDHGRARVVAYRDDSIKTVEVEW